MAGPDFELSTEQDGGRGWRVTVRGELDLATADQLRHALEPPVDGGRVVVDLRGLTFMDSTGVRTLLQATEAAAEAGVELRFILPLDGGARMTMTETGIEKLLPIEEEAA